MSTRSNGKDLETASSKNGHPLAIWCEVDAVQAFVQWSRGFTAHVVLEEGSFGDVGESVSKASQGSVVSRRKRKNHHPAPDSIKLDAWFRFSRSSWLFGWLGGLLGLLIILIEEWVWSVFRKRDCVHARRVLNLEAELESTKGWFKGSVG